MISHVLLPDDLIIEILSFLNVKSLMRFKSVSKPWNKLISDPTFVELHHQHSPKHKHIALTIFRSHLDYRFVTFPLNHLIENPSITVPKNLNNPLKEINGCSRIIGSCNGLLCLHYSSTIDEEDENQNNWFRIWNPATNTISKPLGYISSSKITRLKFTFGYDNSTETYKVVVLYSTDEVKILNLRDNSWRTISSFPPSHHVTLRPGCPMNQGVYLSGTVNWFAIQSNLSFNYYLDDRNYITVDQFVIISLDLATETYMHLSPPRGVDEVPLVEPTIAVLMDCLCFSRDQGPDDFVIWKMAEFGVEQSWTQFLKISYQSLRIRESFSEMRYYQLIPFYLSSNGHTLILASRFLHRAFFYNLKDNRVVLTSDTKINWFFAKSYVESLSSIC